MQFFCVRFIFLFCFLFASSLSICAFDYFNSMTMEKSHRKRGSHISYMCYTTLIMGWHTFNCISSLGVMSMDILNGSNELQTKITTTTAMNLSLTPFVMGPNQQDSISTLSLEESMDTSKLDPMPSSAIDNTPIQGWECYCWNSTFEVNFIFFLKCSFFLLFLIYEKSCDSIHHEWVVKA